MKPTLIVLSGLAVALALSAPPTLALADSAPTAEGALAADDALSKAIRENDADAIARWLDKDWAVISTTGGIGEGRQIFPSGLKSGYLVRKTFDTTEARVRVFGDTALVTTKVRTSGVLRGKSFDVAERQTDVWVSKAGGWTCVLTQETKLPEPPPAAG